MLSGCGSLAAISALACAIAEGKDIEDLELLSIIFSQLGTSLATIATQRGYNQILCSKNNTENEIQPEVL